MLNFEQALNKVLGQVDCLPSERVVISEAQGRVLAEDVYSRENIPNCDRSAMDGYAVRAEDVKAASLANPVRLEVLTDLPAGQQTKKKLQPSTAIRIMTGAPLPKGANAVVMVEYTRQVKIPTAVGHPTRSDFVDILSPVKRGENISQAGEDVQKGELVIKKGTLIRPAEVGMLASLGRTTVRVSRKPLVAVIATGDEVKEINSRLNKGQVRDANSYSITGQAMSCGARVVRLGIARDLGPELLKKISLAMTKGSNIIVLTGGVSVGDYDLVKDVLMEAGVKMIFWKVKIKPGKPIFFGKKGKTLVFGLPGYPVSAMVTFQLFVQPAILAMLGQTDDLCESDKQGIFPVYEAFLEEEIAQHKDRRNFMRGRFTFKDGRIFVRQVGQQKSGILKSMVMADCLIEVPEKVERLKPGQLVKVRPFPYLY